MSPPFIDEVLGRKCLIFCGFDRCTCSAREGMIFLNELRLDALPEEQPKGPEMDGIIIDMRRVARLAGRDQARLDRAAAPANILPPPPDDYDSTDERDPRGELVERAKRYAVVAFVIMFAILILGGG